MLLDYLSLTLDGACPCNSGASHTLPSYIGNNYYCESGGGYIVSDPLWDGKQCNNLESPCCTSSQMPWFNKTLSGPTTGPIELRVCSSEGYPDEATPLDIIELYIR